MARIFCSFPSFGKWPVLLTARVMILIIFLAYALQRVDLRELQIGLMKSQWGLLLAGTLFVALGIPIAAWRWQLILAGLGAQLRFVTMTRLIIIGLFLSQFLPGMVGGDVARIWLTTQAGCGVKDAFNSVTLDRLMMLLVLLSLVLFAVPVLERRLNIYDLQWLAILFLAGGVFSTALLMLGDRLAQTLQRWRAFRAIGYLAADARIIFLSWPLSAALLGISLLSYANMSASMYLFAAALGQNIEIWSFILLVPPVLLVHTLPISIGGWGTREIAAVLLWETIGIGATNAVLISVMFGVANLVISLPGVFLVRSRKRDVVPVRPQPPASSYSAN